MVRLRTPDKTGVTYWEASQSVACDLLVPDGLRLQEWRDRGLLETVKSGPHRDVYRLESASGRFYIKHYKAADWKSLLLNVVRPSRAELEWRAARRISALGFPTFHPLAVGRTIAHGTVRDSYLVSGAIENTMQLDKFVRGPLQENPSPCRRRIRSEIARGLGRLAGLMHRHHVAHRDFHPGNILVRIDPDETVRLWLVDLHAVSFPRWLGRWRRKRNLAQLVPFFDRAVTRSDQWRFFQAYWSSLHGADEPRSRSACESYRDSARRVDAYCRRAATAARRRRDAKWVRGNRRLIIADSRHARCRGLAFLGRRYLEFVRNDPERLLQEAGVRRWYIRTEESRKAAVSLPFDGQDARGTVHITTAVAGVGHSAGAAGEAPSGSGVVRLQGAPLRCVVTAHRGRPAGVMDRLSARAAYGRRAWEAGHALLRRGISTPTPILFVDTRQAGYLVTEHVAGAVRLDRFLREAHSNAPAQRRRRVGHVGRVLARQLRRMHDDGFQNDGLSAREVLVRTNKAETRVWFLSPEYVRKRRRVSLVARSASLARLNASVPPAVGAAQRLRFLKHYLKEGFANGWKPICRDVINRTENRANCRPNGG